MNEAQRSMLDENFKWKVKKTIWGIGVIYLYVVINSLLFFIVLRNGEKKGGEAR